MVNFTKLRERMEESGLDALITVDPRNSYYLAGYTGAVSECTRTGLGPQRLARLPF
jgi:Xaa-Pro aminopeptidase